MSIKLPHKYTEIPFISIHCLFLFFFGFSCISLSIYLRMCNSYPWYTTLPISITGIYSLFPVIHDGSHGTVSNNSALNYGMSFLAGLPFFFAPYPTWRFIHLRHHQFTNIEDKDPDFYSGGNLSSKWLLPLRWITHIIHYYKFFFITISHVLRSKCKRKMEGNTCSLDSIYDLSNDQIIQNNTKVLIISFISIAINISIATYSALYGAFDTLFVLWIMPSALTIILLIFLFDYSSLSYMTHSSVDLTNVPISQHYWY